MKYKIFNAWHFVQGAGKSFVFRGFPSLFTLTLLCCKNPIWKTTLY